MNMLSVKIVVGAGSRNAAKLQATRSVFSSVFSSSVHVTGYDCESGVSKTPFGDEEAIVGCENRIEGLRRQEEQLDFLVGMEGVVERRSFGSFVYGWVVIEDVKSGRSALGCSAKVMLPKEIAEEISPTVSLSELVAGHYGIHSAEQIADFGTNGLVTGGLFTRRHEFETALRCALGTLSTELKKNSELKLGES